MRPSDSGRQCSARSPTSPIGSVPLVRCADGPFRVGLKSVRRTARPAPSPCDPGGHADSGDRPPATLLRENPFDNPLTQLECLPCSPRHCAVQSGRRKTAPSLPLAKLGCWPRSWSAIGSPGKELYAVILRGLRTHRGGGRQSERAVTARRTRAGRSGELGLGVREWKRARAEQPPAGAPTRGRQRTGQELACRYEP